MRPERRSHDQATVGQDRHLVACPACHRQFDVTGRATGTQFHCHCGELLMTAKPAPHSAAVVRCSGCGAPRERGAESCTFCGGDYTLHERDLHTICPGCMARISDKARYCHFCATLIAPQESVGEETEEQCPACGEASVLVSRALAGDRISVRECGRCAGLWLGNAVFKHLEEGAQRLAPPEGAGPPGGARRPANRPTGAARYRPCPICRSLMHRRNYGRKSGVVVDTCQAHGLWFDQGELDAILDWIRRGGLARAREWARQLDNEEERLRRVGREERSAPTWLGREADSGPRPLADLVEGVLRYLSR